MASKKYLPHVSAAVLMACIAFSNPFEGTRYKAYQDEFGYWTICRGHRPAQPGQVATEAECQKYDAEDHEVAVNAVLELVDVPLQPDVLEAMQDFVLNCGRGCFERSSMRRDLNAGQVRQACEDFMKYICGGRRKDGRSVGYCKTKLYSKGLYNRRVPERARCLKGVTPR